MKYPVGKLPHEFLAALLGKNKIGDQRVIVGPAVGEDAAVIDAGGNRYLIAKTDPITFATDRIGWYAVHVNANDIVTMGGIPQWFLATLLLPENQTEQGDVVRIFQDILDACSELKITLIGGHTEITYGLDRPIVIGQMLGEVEKENLVRTAGAREGDAIILTKGIAVEGTAVIARERAADVSKIFPGGELTRIQDFLYHPGISVVKEALLAMEVGGIHSMHDPTEGGLATGLHEVALASNVGLVVEAESLLIFPETQKLCRHYHIDPLGLIASGSLLITCEYAAALKIVRRLQEEDISAAIIGRIVPPQHGKKITEGNSIKDLPIYEQDELTKIVV